jgi:hypothetical protein
MLNMKDFLLVALLIASAHTAIITGTVPDLRKGWT